MKILVNRNHRLGDILQLTPMLAGLKEKYPRSHITFLTSNDFEELLTGNDNIDEIVAFPEKEFRYGLKQGPGKYPYIFNSMYETFSRLRDEKFDLVINRQYEEGGVVADLVKARAVVGGRFVSGRGLVFDDLPSRTLYHVTRSNRRANKMNLVDWSCVISGADLGKNPMELHVPQPDLLRAEGILSQYESGGSRPLVAVQLGAAASFRQWGEENYAEVIGYLLSRGNRIVLVGTQDEHSLAESVTDMVGGEIGEIINAVGRTSIKVLGGILQYCDFLITGDTGTMHVATAVGTPVLSIFYGTAYPWETGPYGSGNLVLFSDEECAPCLNPDECVCAYKCKRSITPHMVVRAFETLHAIWRGECPYRLWSYGNVSLLATHVRPGEGQRLVPIEEWQGMAVALQRPGLDQRMGTRSGKKCRQFFREKEILDSYYRGDKREFIGAFSKYVDYLSPILLNYDTSPTPQTKNQRHDVSMVLSEAISSLESEDTSRMADLVRYGLGPIERSIENRETPF